MSQTKIFVCWKFIVYWEAVIAHGMLTTHKYLGLIYTKKNFEGL